MRRVPECQLEHASRTSPDGRAGARPSGGAARGQGCRWSRRAIAGRVERQLDHRATYARRADPRGNRFPVPGAVTLASWRLLTRWSSWRSTLPAVRHADRDAAGHGGRSPGGSSFSGGDFPIEAELTAENSRLWHNELRAVRGQRQLDHRATYARCADPRGNRFPRSRGGHLGLLAPPHSMVELALDPPGGAARGQGCRWSRRAIAGRVERQLDHRATYARRATGRGIGSRFRGGHLGLLAHSPFHP